ncbi:response regulator receiver sensor signal transduction histidine kinase, partial [Candidatus Magnetomorum sp. HK-1]
MSQSNSLREKPLILMVDDVPKNLQVLGNILGADQYLITPAMSGEQALARVEQLMPDLILLDVMMPGIDGFETCRQIKANPKTKGIPIIFLTAKVETVDVVKGFKVGAVDYVTKPFQAEELLTRVETHISLRKKTLELKSLYTELKQNEEKYRGLFVSSIDAILRINADFQIKDANPGTEKLLGQSIEGLNQNLLTNFLATDQKDRIQKIITQEVSINGYSEAFECEIIKADRTITPVEMRLWQSGET